MVIALCACGSQEDRTETGANISTSKRQYNVTYLFEVDGIKVYRFRDGSNEVYFTDTSGNVESNYTKTTPRYMGITATHHRTQTICNNR